MGTFRAARWLVLGCLGMCACADEIDPQTTGSPFWHEPWTIPQRDWPVCDTSYGTARLLADKAAYYQWLVPRLHRLEGQSADGRRIVHALHHHTCLDGEHPTSIVPHEQLPQVARFESYGNAGLWTSLYVASQAFRYAVAESESDRAEQEAALEELTVVLESIYSLLRITGKPGLYARGYWSPLPEFDPPEPGEDTHFVETGEFAGYTWAGDVSQDEYAGHMYALGVVARLVDDPHVQEICRDIASQVGHHLKENHLWIIDVDGEVTKYGRMNAFSFTHFTGYNAFVSLTWMKLAGQISGEQELVDYYDNCLLQKQGHNPCIDHQVEPVAPYTDYLDRMTIQRGCSTNHDAVSQAFLAAANLIWFEESPELRKLYQRALHDMLMVGDTEGRDVVLHKNPFFNMIYAAMMDYGDPEVTPPEPLIHDALCELMEFSEDQRLRTTSTMHHREVCTSDRHGSLAGAPIPWRQQPEYLFKWWRNPYERQEVDAGLRCGDLPSLETPADYLLPYYMGRYFGWIDESW